MAPTADAPPELHRPLRDVKGSCTHLADRAQARTPRLDPHTHSGRAEGRPRGRRRRASAYGTYTLSSKQPRPMRASASPHARPSPPPSSRGDRAQPRILDGASPCPARRNHSAPAALLLVSSLRRISSFGSPRSLSLCVYPRVSASVPYLYRPLIVRRTPGAARFYPRSLPVIDSSRALPRRPCPRSAPCPLPLVLPRPPVARLRLRLRLDPPAAAAGSPRTAPALPSCPSPVSCVSQFSQADTFFEPGIITSIYDIVALLPACLTTPIINQPFDPTSHFALHLLVTIHPFAFASGSPCSPSSHCPLTRVGVIARPCFTISFPPCAASGAAI